MNNESESKVQRFATLKSKYQATKYENSSPASLLYLILRKADIGIEITELEFDWLIEHKLFETLEILEQNQRYRAKEISQLEAELFQIKSKYQVTTLKKELDVFSPLYEQIHRLTSKFNVTVKKELEISSPLYAILIKLGSENLLTNLEIEWLKQNSLANLADLAHEMGHFGVLKAKYKANQHQDSSPKSYLYRILKKLEAEERLSDSDVNWLQQKKLLSTLEIFQQQGKVRQARFAQLKDKYQATKHLDPSVSSPLYLILQKFEADNVISHSDRNWLKQHELTDTIAIADELEQKRIFAALKVKYKANQYEDLSLSSHLYKILKRLESCDYLPEADLNFLRKRQLTETINIALDKYAVTLKLKIKSGEQLNDADVDWLKQNERENIIILGQQKHFADLKSKYDVSDYKDQSPSSPLYVIMQKLEKLERLNPTDVAWLETNETEGYQQNYSYYTWREDRNYRGHKLLSGKILTTYHKIEAIFYEEEYKQTGNKWNLPNASSHWRKAGEPKQALKITDNLGFDKIQGNKLKSALLTTRGGAFRDVSKLDDAEDCAKKAIEYQPNSHHPYTLMGAICFERYQHSEGEHWFSEAIKRGASPKDIDAEMKRIAKNIKDDKKRQEFIKYLLKKDASRYAWAKAYGKDIKTIIRKS